MLIYPAMLRNRLNQSIVIELLDSTTKLPVTGKVAANITASLAQYKASPISAVLVALGSITAGFTQRGFIEIDAVKCPGLYRLDIPNSVFVNDGVTTQLVVSLVCTGCVPVNIIIPLTDTNENPNISN